MCLCSAVLGGAGVVGVGTDSGFGLCLGALPCGIEPELSHRGRSFGA